MKKKRISAVVTAASCAAMMLSAMPVSMPASASMAVSNDFETDYEGWHGNTDAVVLTAVAGLGVNGSRGMVVSERSTPDEGAVAEKDLFLFGGIDYKYAVRVFAETDETFHFTLRTVSRETGEEIITELESKEVAAGTWATLSGMFTAPEHSYEFELTITTDSTNDFRFDDLKITTKNEKGVLKASAATAQKGLKDEFVNYGFRIGNILNWQTIDDQGILQRLIKDCNAIECENETKPDATLVQNGSTDTNIKVNLNGIAKIADFCIKNGMAFRGHTMVWHSQTPEWFLKEGFNANGNWTNPSTMNKRLESYIKNMFAAYNQQYPSLYIYSYDVCNECMSDNAAACNGSDGHRTGGSNRQKDSAGVACSPWVAVYGDNSFINKAFEYARTYAPKHCKLFYNDYNEYADFKRDAIIRKAKELQASGLIDGIGMQSHVDAGATGWSGTDVYIKAMKMYLQLGLEVHISELDISVKGKSESEQVTKYKTIFQEAMNWNATHTNPGDGRVTLIQVWGPDDGHSWLSAGSNGTLYNSSGQPKAAYNAITQLVPQNEWGDGTQFPDSINIAEPEPDADGYWFHYTFENGDEGFGGRSGGEKLTVSSDAAYAGSKSLYVSGRTAAWHGASHSLNSRVFKAGEEYSFSAAVKLASGSADTVHFTMQYANADGETEYIKIDTQSAVEGEWVQLSNTNFKIPDGASNMVIYIEADGETSSYYIDEMIGAPAGTKIAGPGPGAKLIRGDVDCDGVVTAKDLSLAKLGMKKGFDGVISEKAADVDQNGGVDADDLKQLVAFLTGQITEFERAAITVDNEKMEALFSKIKPATSWKLDNENNPLTTQRFGADPGWMVYGDRLYLYTTNDAFEYMSDGRIHVNTYNSGTINCISSDDLINWTDHGAIPAAARNSRTQNGAASWASFAWAPDAAWKNINGKDQFFLYFADSAGGIGVLQSDSPIGPFRDPLGKQLITRQTENCSGVDWMFDPGVYYDEASGEGYIAFGGGTTNRDASNPKTGRIAKLGNDMISLVSGTVKEMQTPYLFEDSSLIKIDGTWFYSYCSNFSVPGGTKVNGVQFNSGEILCMTSTNPLGPWTASQLKCKVLPGTGGMVDNGGNNHHSIIYFKDKYYVAYHARQQALRMGITAYENDGRTSKDGNYRSTQLNEATYNAGAGTVTCRGDMTGITKQLKTLNPYETVQAETMAQQAGIQISGVGNTVVTDTNDGDWIKIKGVEFSKGCSTLTVKVSSTDGAAIKVCTGSASGDAIGYVEIPAGTRNAELTVPVASITGTKDLCFVFSGKLDFDCWSFEAK